MAKITKYVTPLSMVSLFSFLFAVKLYLTPSGHGTTQYFSLFHFFLISLPSLVANAIINKTISNSKTRFVIQFVLLILFVLLSYYMMIN